MRDIEKVFRKWVEEDVENPDVKKFLLENQFSYIAWLVYFLEDTIHKQKNKI